MTKDLLERLKERISTTKNEAFIKTNEGYETRVGRFRVVLHPVSRPIYCPIFGDYQYSVETCDLIVYKGSKVLITAHDELREVYDRIYRNELERKRKKENRARETALKSLERALKEPGVKD